ncbi:cofactor assembly of complex C subunit B [Leptolyngbya cf. ectocarpi LEGE 11479]|uniref:Cofactor assembly of complex C subunit B n=1 Tax=Leptolyngbya cf. ectocarpi LEGE 11479 TaxID=1828722 RepID=A0A928ZZE4_LEPEC|nr:cofactor assembly of complex C subunit B [Leptolyngbya ectocarpi]MBE9070319.1 cofactor assembly of complex C subunit B [Leptolyngbya cf. ectocarpi LEGE 11479]
MAKADENQWLRRLPLVVGMAGGTLLMLNRLLTPVVTDSQARADVVGVFLSAILILTTLLWQQIQPVLPEAVILEGEEGFELADGLSDAIATELAWASHLLLTNTVTRSLVAYYDGQVLMRRGVLGPHKNVEVGPILERVLSQKKPVYLVSLKLYPGKVEFNYLPENTQGIICQPMGDKGALILGANAPRSYTKQDETWIEGIADKLGASLDALATFQVTT